MKSIFRKVSTAERMPEHGKFVTTIDIANEHRVYRFINENGGYWNMRDLDGTNSPNNNLGITHWLEEVDLTDNKIRELFKKALDEDTHGLDYKNSRLLRRGFELGIESLAE